jgi:photosystem II stability/assembly factor-like uncharacterized protein
MGNNFHKRIFKILMLVFTGVLHATPLTQIAIGNLVVGSPNAVILITHDGYSFQLVKPLEKLGTLYGTNLASAACFEKTCIATGFYDYGTQFPVQGTIIVSQDEGASWNFISPFAKIPNFDFANLPSSTCINNLCIVAGSYNKTNAALTASLLVSQDQGTSWDLQTPLANTINVCKSELVAVSCTQTACIAAGNYSANCKSLLMNDIVILKSVNNGRTWDASFPLKKLSKTAHEHIFDLDCSGNFCVAVGIKDTYKNHAALLLTSSTAGDTWTASEPFIKIPNVTSSGLDKVWCKDNLCFASGYYVTNDSLDEIATILRSTDSGQSWDLITPLQKIPNLEAARINNKINCFDAFCLAPANFTVNGRDAGIILESSDQGVSWQIIFPFKDMPELAYSYINSIHCNAATCIASSSFYNPQKNTENQAAILTSSDHGKVWKFIEPFLQFPNYWSATLPAVAGA